MVSQMVSPLFLTSRPIPANLIYTHICRHIYSPFNNHHHNYQRPFYPSPSAIFTTRRSFTRPTHWLVRSSTYIGVIHSPKLKLIPLSPVLITTNGPINGQPNGQPPFSLIIVFLTHL